MLSKKHNEVSEENGVTGYVKGFNQQIRKIYHVSDILIGARDTRIVKM